MTNFIIWLQEKHFIQIAIQLNLKLTIVSTAKSKNKEMPLRPQVSNVYKEMNISC